MTVFRRTVLVLFSCVLSGTAVAQEIPRAKPVNLQVLPKDTSSASVGKLMKRFEKELGVTCSHCHVENPQTQKLDYASDDKPEKQTARVMIAMLDDINNKYLAQLGGDRRYSVPVTCGSCHQGQSNPPAFEPRSRL
jgi:hypothetical protein